MMDTNESASSQDRAWTTPREAPADALPAPTTERWQPLRLGLVDLFYYDDEQFWFHDGRLLLRGNNGTGKSKVLALTLPFLLDGSIHPRRVEPDADPRKRMEWNLLLGGEHDATERTGYSWVEFGRVDADGTPHFTTLGIGLKAAAGRGIVKSWFFVTPRRIGDVRLVDADRVVLTQERLRDEFAAAGAGQVFTTQDAYRRAVDEALFKLGEERYAALIDLLIQLRQPQLSKKPDEKALSAALTEALSPLDQAVVVDVAESFRSLEEERAGIADARDTLSAAEQFLEHYRGYAKVAARRHTTAVREANSDYERAGRNLRDAEVSLEAVAGEIDDLAAAKAEAEDRRSALQGQQQALRESPEARDADRLVRAEHEATDMSKRSTRAEHDAEQARLEAERDAATATETARRWTVATEDRHRREEGAKSLAGAAGLAAEHPALAADESAADQAVRRRREQVVHVRTLVDEDHRGRDRAGQLRGALDEEEAKAAGRAEEVESAEASVETAVDAHRDAVRQLLAGLRTITIEQDSDELVRSAEDWARSPAGASPSRLAVEAAAATVQRRLARERVTAEHTLRHVEEELGHFHTEIAHLEAGHDPAPPPAPGRTHDDRLGRDGAPLWRLTDFAAHVPDADRAGLEAALQSAGLLDAWVFPDGTVQTDGDVVLGPAGPEAHPSLATMVIPVAGPSDDVSGDAVAAVLARIGLGEFSAAALWVDPSGRWGAGPAHGSWSKERAEHVGAGARETGRRERLAVLGRLVQDAQTRREACLARIAAIDENDAQVREESGRYPGHTELALVSAHSAAAAAQRELGRAQQAVGAARARWEDADQAAARAATDLAEQAAMLNLGTTTVALDEVTGALVDYTKALTAAWGAARTVADLQDARDLAAARALQATAVQHQRAEEAGALRMQASNVSAQLDVLQATVGASVAELQARLGDVARELEESDATLKSIDRGQLTAATKHGNLQQKVTDLAQRRSETSTGREQRVAALRDFVATGLLRVAAPDLAAPSPELTEEWHVTSALALSRAAEQLLDTTDESDEAWSRSQQRVSSASTELASQMSRHGHTAFIEQHGDVLVSRVRYFSEEIDVDRLASRLAEDVAGRERLLSAREREILENHLVNEVAGHLHELLLAAENQIDAMNNELAARRTSTGMQLRVRWRERGDGPAGLAAARALMLRSDATWTATDRTAIGDFLQAQIGDARQNDPTGGWQEHLEQALDYRQWHAFTVERLQNGQWRSASGPASGGEKVLAVSVPLFAAASAHYNSAGPLAPRLILLDEAFAGVDDDSRAKSLGLLATFDLDVVMTSEREWGCYPQVPGLSIAQLSRVEGVKAVGVTRWRWDGRHRARVVEVANEARATAGLAPSSDDATLFG